MPRGRRLVAAQITAICAAVIGCGAHPAAGRHGAGVLYVVADDPPGVYRVNPDGTGLARLPFNPDSPSEEGPVFSVAPGEKTVAFVSKERVSFAAPDGSHIRQAAARFGTPSTWSPDGAFIASTSLTGDEAIQILDADGKSSRLIPVGGEGEPAWSPKGDVLAVSEDDATGAPGAAGIYAVTPDDGRQKLLIRDAVLHGDIPVTLAWSPDAKHIAFAASSSNDLQRLYVGDTSTGKVWRLTRHEENNVSIAWSPDSSRLAFASTRKNEPSKVYVVGLDGSGERVVSQSTGGESSAAPQWAPDGTRIAYVRDRVGGGNGTSGDVYLVRPDGRGTRPLLAPGAEAVEAVAVAWTSLPRLPAGVVRRPPLVTVITPSYVLRTHGVGEIDAHGSTVAVEEAAPPASRHDTACGRVLVWSPQAGTEIRSGADCGPGGALDSPRLVGSGVMWNFSEWDRYPIADCLLSWSAAKDAPVAEAPYGDCTHWPASWFARQGITSIPRPRNDASQIVSDGETLLYNAVRLTCYDPAIVVRSIEQASAQPSGLAAGTPMPWCRKKDAHARSDQLLQLASGRLVPVRTPASLVVLDAFDGALIAGREDEHHVVVLRLGGNVVLRRAFADPVTAVRLGGGLVAVQTGASLTVVEVATGRAQRLHLSNASGPPTLRSFDGHVAAYSSGAHIHLLRVADARDRTLATPPAVGPVDAKFVASGLYYSYNLEHTREPGRVAFLPNAAIARAFTRP